jgi:hypothetical protein
MNPGKKGSKWIHIEVTDFYDLFYELEEEPKSWRELFEIARKRKLKTEQIFKLVRAAVGLRLFGDEFPDDKRVYLTGGVHTVKNRFEQWKATIPTPSGGVTTVRETTRTEHGWARYDDQGALKTATQYLLEAIPLQIRGRLKAAYAAGGDVEQLADRLREIVNNIATEILES